jgi:osmotically-inducible protein OsmY
LAERTGVDLAVTVTRALEWDAQVPVEKLEVTVSKGWVTLQGEVEWEYQRRAAERAVRDISGVRGLPTSSWYGRASRLRRRT